MKQDNSNKRNKRKPKQEPEEENEEVKKRADWEINDSMIYSAFIGIATTKKRYPKLREIQEKTGLSINTIHKHLQGKDSSFEHLKEKYSMFTEAALFKLATNAAAGKSKDYLELYFKVIHGLGERKQLDLTSGGKPFGAVDFSKLSDEDLKALRSIKEKVNAE